MSMPMIICGAGGGIAGSSIAAHYDTGIICGTMLICAGLIVTAIQIYR